MNERTLVSFDWAMKSILRQKDNFDILEGFLTDLLGEKIEILDLLESESNKDNKYDKMNRVGLRARDSLGREIIIEVQHSKEPDYLERVYYGTCKSLIDNMQEGYRYKNIKKIISVNIIYWQMLEKSYLLKGEMQLKDLTGNKLEVQFKPDQNIFAEYYFIQLEWFEDNIKSLIDEWVYLFKHSKVKGDMRATNMDKVPAKLDKLKMTQEELRAYDEYQFNKTINEGVLQVKYDEGIEEGIEKGRSEIIEAMRKSGLSEDKIVEIIGLSSK